MFSSFRHFSQLGKIGPDDENSGTGVRRQFLIFSLPQPVFINQAATRQDQVFTTQVNEGR